MRTQNIMKGIVMFALLGLVGSAFTPTAAAQYQQDPTLNVEVKSQTSDQQLKPLQGSIVLKGSIKFNADGLSPRSSFTGVTVELKAVQFPAWATVVVNPPQVTMAVEGAPSNTVQLTEDFDVFVTASDLAPAFQDAVIIVEAKALSTQATNQKIATAPATIKASYFSILDISLPEAIKVERPQTPVAFPITITNYGNGPTKVNFDLVTPPGEGDKMQIAPPQGIQLEARQTGGSQITKDAILNIQTPFKNGYLNEPRSISLKISSHYATDSTLQGASDTVTVLVTTKGFYVPGPSPIFMVGLVALAAVAFRHVRK